MNFVIDDTDIVIRKAIVDNYTCIHVIDVCAFKVEYTKLYYKTFMYKQALGWRGGRVVKAVLTMQRKISKMSYVKRQ